MINDGNDALRAKENCFGYSFHVLYILLSLMYNMNGIMRMFLRFFLTYFFMLEDLSCVILL
jgi:hypothetical protein